VPSRETLDALTSQEFLAGLVFGVAALTIGALVVYVWRRRRSTPVPIVGVLLTLAALPAIGVTRDLPIDLWFGIVLLGVAGTLYPWARRVPLLPAALVAPGAWWMTQVVELPGAAWVPWLLFAWIILSTPLVTSFDRHFAERGYATVFLLVSIAGMFATLPDTEEILVVFGVAVPLALLAWPMVKASLGAIGIYPVLGVMAWVIAFGGRGRESAVIGAAAGLAFLVIEPLVRWWRGRTLLDRVPGGLWWVPAAGAFQLVVVLLSARVAGLSETPRQAALVATLTLSAVAATLVAADGRAPEHLSESHATRGTRPTDPDG